MTKESQTRTVSAPQSPLNLTARTHSRPLPYIRESTHTLHLPLFVYIGDVNRAQKTWPAVEAPTNGIR